MGISFVKQVKSSLCSYNRMARVIFKIIRHKFQRKDIKQVDQSLINQNDCLQTIYLAKQLQLKYINKLYSASHRQGNQYTLKAHFFKFHLFYDMYILGYIIIVLVMMQNYEAIYQEISDMLDNVNFLQEPNLAQSCILGSSKMARSDPFTNAAQSDPFRDAAHAQAQKNDHQLIKTSGKQTLLYAKDNFSRQKNSDLFMSCNNTFPNKNARSSFASWKVRNKPKHQAYQKGIHYKKNILGYIAKKSINIMLSSHKKVLRKMCKKAGIDYKQFEWTFQTAQRSIYGPQSLTKLFQFDPNNEQDCRSMEIFKKLLTRILRKKYLVYSLKLGKMQDIDTYIRQKNTHLMYFADQLRQTT